MDAILGPSKSGGHIDASSIPVPGGCRVAFDSDTHLMAEGRALLGGSPLRLMRLTVAGAETVRSLRQGVSAAEVGADQPGARARLMRRLLTTGMAHPRHGGPGPSRDEVAVVVPARDRASELPRLLARIGPVGDVVVVDDASIDDSAMVAELGGARVVRRDRAGGPGAARNSGLSAVTAPFVAFLDSDCEPTPGWLERVLVHFEDPAVVAVAPRIVEPPGSGSSDSAVARYEAVRSPLDLGSRESPVMPRSRVPYVPAAALVVRREVATAIGGFDESLTTGEDVDFVWRLAAGGGAVRYEPVSRVVHHHRIRLAEMLGRRIAYGRAAGPLAKRHPENLPAVEVSGWTLGAWTLAAIGHPIIGAGVAAGSAGVLARRSAAIEVEEAFGGLGYQMTRVALLGHWNAGRLLASAITRTWLPLFVLGALFSRRVRSVLLIATVVPGLIEWARRRPRVDPLRYLVLRILDDGAYALGVWQGCFHERCTTPLLPRLTSSQNH